MLVTWFLSMWINNTSTTALMVPVAMAVHEQMSRVKVRFSTRVVVSFLFFFIDRAWLNNTLHIYSIGSSFEAAILFENIDQYHKQLVILYLLKKCVFSSLELLNKAM